MGNVCILRKVVFKSSKNLVEKVEQIKDGGNRQRITARS
jgi:hypothetical protein